LPTNHIQHTTNRPRQSACVSGEIKIKEKYINRRPTQIDADEMGSRFAGKKLGHPDGIGAKEISSRLKTKKY
jgi:hypothetical protein